MSFLCFADFHEPIGHYYPKDNIGLFSISLTSKLLLSGFLLLVIGWIISIIKQKRTGKGSVFGGVLIGVGLFCCFPAIGWIQTLFISILRFGFVIILIVIGILILFKFLKGK